MKKITGVEKNYQDRYFDLLCNYNLFLKKYGKLQDEHIELLKESIKK